MFFFLNSRVVPNCRKWNLLCNEICALQIKKKRTVSNDYKAVYDSTCVLYQVLGLGKSPCEQDNAYLHATRTSRRLIPQPEDSVLSMNCMIILGVLSHSIELRTRLVIILRNNNKSTPFRL